MEIVEYLQSSFLVDGNLVGIYLSVLGFDHLGSLDGQDPIIVQNRLQRNAVLKLLI